MHRVFLLVIGWTLIATGRASDVIPIPQGFRQEVKSMVGKGLPDGMAALIDVFEGQPRVFASGQWYERREDRWEAASDRSGDGEFVVLEPGGRYVRVEIPWRQVKQVARRAGKVCIVTDTDPYLLVDGKAVPTGWPSRYRVNQAAIDGDGTLWVASSGGIFYRSEKGWIPLGIEDGRGRGWGVKDVLGVCFDEKDRLWLACQAGVAVRDGKSWQFYEGKDGLPYNDFTGIAAGADVWFATKLGAIRFSGGEWHYRQGSAWLPADEIRQVAVDADGTAWFVTTAGLGAISFNAMTLAEKAEHYEKEIEAHIKRTEFGYVAEAPLRTPGDRMSAGRTDSDNDGLWTAMYGAGQCFAYGGTGHLEAKRRAKGVFEALRFLQKVTQGGPHAPPAGYIARTILPTSGPDPNAGRLERDREEQKGDKLWKAYEPRWPKSADGKYYWKSDTSSDELDGHYFFYPLYYEFCADTEDEKERVREVVRGITDHLLKHDFTLIDHDGQPTRWGIYGPKQLNNDPNWWGERGLKSLSVLSYLAGAAYITGDSKYENAARELVERHGYGHNLMYAKVQHGPGSGNQSDDEMAVMCYYNLLRYGKDEGVKALARYSFYRYWAGEAPEMNPFFNIAYAAHGLNGTMTNAWGVHRIGPWPGWLDDSAATLYGFPLDRLNWGRRNSHRLDIQLLGLERSVDLYEPRRGGRGHRVNGKVLPVENRHFNHWNTDPWRLDYGGSGEELASGTVFLLPYYMGVYHGFIEKPKL